MDSNIQKLKSRLNVKFEPLYNQRKSLKKIEHQAIQKTKFEQSQVIKKRSSSQVRLPSLNKSKHTRLETVQDSRSYVNVVELKEKSKSFKQIPKVKIESKQAINHTLTYLMRNEILNVPRIVALLQKGQSEEFIYLKNTGMYEYQACDERSKGFTYVTVSKNGMVQNGELIPLEVLVKEFETFKRLKKIALFRYYPLIKCLGKWKEGSKKVRFTEYRRNLSKQLNLNDKKFLHWKMLIFNMFEIQKQGGWIQQHWIGNLVDFIREKKNECKQKLAQICFRMLQQFELPISDSTDLMNRVLGNLSALSISFEKKLRIQKQSQKFYRLGRQLQLNAMQKTSEFLIKHIQRLIQKIRNANNNYRINILDRLQGLDVMKDNYFADKEVILLDSAATFDIDYTLYYNPVDRVFGIRPSPQQIYSSCISHIRHFIKQIDRLDFRMIRTQQFNFIKRNVFKTEIQETQDEQEKRNVFRKFVYGISKYEQVEKQLECTFVECQGSFVRKIQTLNKFLQVYLQYVDDKRQKYEFTYIDIVNQRQRIEDDKKLIQKFGEGESFIYGYLKTGELKNHMLEHILKYQQSFYQTIPIQVSDKKRRLEQILTMHEQVLNSEQQNASSFILISQQIQRIQDNFLQYSAAIDQIQKIQEFYYKITKNKIHSINNIKNSLTQIRIKIRGFEESRENSFNKYRRSLQLQKQRLTKRVISIGVIGDEYFNPESDTRQTYKKSSQMVLALKLIQKQVSQLNTLQTYYNLKTTIFGVNQIPLKQYENIEEIWQFRNCIERDMERLCLQSIRDIESESFIKFYQPFKRKSERYVKDADLSRIAYVCLQKIGVFLNSMQIVTLMKSEHLRYKDINEISYHFERCLGVSQHGLIKCLDMNLSALQELNVVQMKVFVSEVVFKSKKQMQILSNIQQFGEWWKNVRLDYEVLANYPLIYIYGQNLHIRNQIDQYMIMLLNILNNKYGTFVRAECNQLFKRLNSLADMLQLAEIHQEKFLNLFPILTSKYAQSQLSSQCSRFETILNKNMKNIRGLAKPTENLNETMKNLLNNHIKQFESISRYLSKFLQKKKMKFQRFYFLQDYELLQVLVGIADDKNIFRMFEGVKGWLFSQSGIRIGVIGIGNEQLILRGWNYKNAEPEVIFKSLEQSIKSNLNSTVRNTLYQYQIELKQLEQLYTNIPWMCIYAVELILFTKQVELNCLQNGILLQAQQSLIKQAISNAVNLNPIIYANYITLQIQLLHFVEQLRKEGVNSVLDFQWNSFLRYYYEKEGVSMRALNTEIKWGGQYQGLWSLMVNTSDIRRAHVCVLNSLHYASGVLLQGPSGTGKTESLKELARCTAKYCVIFNCSQNVDLKTMGKLLSALCYTASWLCLDEVNRLTLQSMSVIAKQIQSIKTAIVSKKSEITLMGKDIKLKPGVAIFATMNPIYLKRAKLTENIKSCFRTITVSMPEYETILEVLLHGMKLYNTRELAEKIGGTFATLAIQLGKDQQYDFGLRAMKILINKIGKRKIDGDNDYEIVGKAFYDVFLNRLKENDKIIFQKAIFDNFKYQPKVVLDNQLRIKSMKESNQTGLIVFGPVSTKSTLIREFCQTYENPNVKLFNPVSVDLKYFLGEFVHGKWQQGIVQKIARESLNESQKIHILILDSVLRSEIIQNFNTLLDESKLLTLSNGTRLKIMDNFKIVMETPNLNSISPSTITRCNIFYVNDSHVQTQKLILNQIPEGVRGMKKACAKIIKIYNNLNNSEIRSVGQLSQIIIADKLPRNKNIWKDNDMIGFQKSVIFACRLLGLDNKIQEMINKDNSISLKKVPFDFILSFDRTCEGEFIDISRTYEPVIFLDELFLKTSQVCFTQWMTSQSILRQRKPIVWSSKCLSGKTKSLIWSLQNEKYFKISLNVNFSTKQISKIILPQMLDKKVDEIKEKPQLIIYLENIHLSNEQVSEQIRFMMEHQMIFSPQARDIVPLLAMAFVAQSRILKENEFERVIRHFSCLSYPDANQIQKKNIYCVFVEHEINTSNLQQNLKSLINIESQRFCSFLSGIDSKENGLQGLYFINRIFKRIKLLDSSNCRQINDFIGFMIETLKVESTFGKIENLDDLCQGFLQNYKGKFSRQYDVFLKGNNFLLNPDISIQQKTSSLDFIAQMILDDDSFKKLYFSKYVEKQILNILRIFKNQAAQYVLIGSQGSGRKNLFKIACKIANLSVYQLPNQISEKQIRSLYFEKIKKGFETKTKQVIILNSEKTDHKKFLDFSERIKIGEPVASIFESDESDYMYARNLDFEKEKYSKSPKSYQEVCQDFVRISDKYVVLLIASQSEGKILKQFGNWPSIKKQAYFHSLQEYPLQSLMQCFDKIFNDKLSSQQKYMKQSYIFIGLPRLFMKIYKCLIGLQNVNKKNERQHFKFNHFHIFKLFELFCKEYTKIYEMTKDSQQILIKSIRKVVQTQKQLSKLQEQIMRIEPDIISKKARILEVVPILEDRKRNTEEIKFSVESQRREIETKKEEIQGIMKQVEQQIANATPLLNQAIDSIQTIKRTDLSEIKNNLNPHPLIKFTMENIVILLGENQSWENIKRILSDINLLSRVKNCQPSDQAYRRVKKRVQNNSQWNFDSVSKTAYGTRFFYKWIMSIVKYKDIEVQITKQRQYTDKLKVSLMASEAKAQQKVAELQKNENDSKKISEEYGKIKKQLNDLEELISNNKRKLSNAQKIKNSLHENVLKWEKKLLLIKERENHLPSYTVFLCLEIYLFPSMTFEEQVEMKKEISKIFLQEKFALPQEENTVLDVVSFENPHLFQKLTLEDLKDPQKVMLAYHFHENPLIIDPDNQAQNWLKKILADRKIIFTKKNFIGSTKIAEQAMRNGDILSILIDSEIDNFGQQILKTIQSANWSTQNLVEYNKNTFELNKDFILLFFCKSKSPKISVKTSLRFQVINFEITKLSLHKNLLLSALEQEKPDLFEMKSKIEEDLEKTGKIMEKMERQIIQSLLMNKKDLVEDQTFVDLLQANSKKADFFQEKKKHQQQSISQASNFIIQFEKTCEKISDVFISLKQIRKINPNLVWDVEILIQYFNEACRDSVSEFRFQQQIDEGLMNKSFVGGFQFEEINPILTSRPTSSFSGMSLAMSMAGSEQNIESEDILSSARSPKFELKQIESIDPIVHRNSIENENLNNENDRKEQNSLFNSRNVIVNEEQKGYVSNIRHLRIIENVLGYLKKSFSFNERLTWSLFLILKDQNQEHVNCLMGLIFFGKKKSLNILCDQNMLTDGLKKFITKNSQQKVQEQALKIVQKVKVTGLLSQEIKDKLSLTEVLILAHILSYENFLSLTRNILNAKGFIHILEYEQNSSSDWISQSDNIHPAFLFMGQDPIPTLSQYLEKKKYKNATLVAMGEEQGKGFDQLIQRESRKEGIFIIHNLHIATSFLPLLGRIIQQFNYKPPHRNFRLILIGSVDIEYPDEIISMCHKFIIQQPPGLKNKIRGLYLKSENYINHEDKNQHRLTYSLCLMHSIINQMQKYGSLCWNFPHTFTTSDYMGSLMVIKSVCSGFKDEEYQCNIDREEIQKLSGINQINFQKLRYLIGQICYVGKMTDEIDRKKMRLIVESHFHQNVIKNNYVFWQGSRGSEGPAQVFRLIDKIEESNPKTFGLNQKTVDVSQSSDNVLVLVTKVLGQGKRLKPSQNQNKFHEIPEVNHKLAFINSEIKEYNIGRVYSQQGQFLKEITSSTMLFNLKSFKNPRQLFVSVKIQTAIKNNVPYDAVSLVWFLVPKQGAYGVTNLTLQGGEIKNSFLVQGCYQKQVNVYFSAVVQKKDKDPNKGKISIPLYFNKQRGQYIGTYGENINLLSQVYLDSKQLGQIWVMKGTAFIAN